MNECLNCQKPITQTEGRRKKVYCSDSCRAAFNQKKNAGKKLYVRIETFEAMKKELEELRALKFQKPSVGNQKSELLVSEVKYAPATAESYDGKKLDKGYMADEPALSVPMSDNALKLAEYEAELPNVPENTILGKKRRQFLEYKIKELKSK